MSLVTHHHSVPMLGLSRGIVLLPSGTHSVSCGVFCYTPEGEARLQVSCDNGRCPLIKVCVEKLSLRAAACSEVDGGGFENLASFDGDMYLQKISVVFFNYES